MAVVAEASWCQCHIPKVVTVPPSPLLRDHPSDAATYRVLRLPPPVPRLLRRECSRLRPEAGGADERICGECALYVATGPLSLFGCSVCHF